MRNRSPNQQGLRVNIACTRRRGDGAEGVDALALSGSGGRPVCWRVPRLLVAGNEVDGSDGDLVDAGPLVCDGPSDGHSEVVVELGGCEGTGGLDEEGTGIAVEGDGVGVPQVGVIVTPTDLKFERVFYGSPYFFY